MNEIDPIFILGAPNDENGGLSQLARARVETAASICKDRLASGRRPLIVPTGGHGAHFNRGPRPHWVYVRRDLLLEGVPEEAISKTGLESGNTVEDVAMIARYTADHGCSACSVVTSAFHIERCTLLFGCLAPFLTVQFLSANNPPDLGEEATIHEQKAIAQLLSQGGVLHNDKLFPIRAV
ncbi:YdcF family protein [Parasphingopyxis algicola]|uniref:YdcF family protein n=1 Tax=Parasphingopyxis algicola TaxID=2026624 RepID=UPI0015A0B00A|nr:YdcF family protein [Parasphingopyxis algicola]QLC24284.1 YdcF family protein [Parasphingopyxis algicola]